jgi:hypothetical protein
MAIQIKRRWSLGIAGFLIIATIAIYGLREYYRTNLPMEEMKISERISSTELLNAFTDNDSTANARFLGKVLLVEGPLKTIDLPNKLISLGNGSPMSSIQCSLENSSVPDARQLKKGDVIVVKGNCTGFNADELLGTDVILNRAIVIARKGGTKIQ